MPDKHEAVIGDENMYHIENYLLSRKAHPPKVASITKIRGIFAPFA
jgi:hypothetical protein